MPAKRKDFLTRAKSAHQLTKVTVPGMDGEEVFAKVLSAAEIRAITEQCKLPGTDDNGDDKYDDAKVVLMVVAASIVDGKGSSLIPIDRHEEIDDLPNAIKIALQNGAMKANGMGDVGGADQNP